MIEGLYRLATFYTLVRAKNLDRQKPFFPLQDLESFRRTRFVDMAN